jgi:hypothetical protein
VYDYYLGGSHNFEVDRQMAEEAIRLWPELPRLIRSNRAFLRRAVTFLAGQGIDQFLDIGSGIPTVGNVHEVARRVAPRARVLYVDRDPVAVAHSRAILAGDPNTRVLQADLRRPAEILDHPDLAATLDLTRPVALLLVAVLHFVPDADGPEEAVHTLRQPLARGSYLVLSHASPSGTAEKAATHQELYQRTPTPMTMRTEEQIERFFEGFELVPPGLVPLARWRPDEDAAVGLSDSEMAGHAGVGRKQ